MEDGPPFSVGSCGRPRSFIGPLRHHGPVELDRIDWKILQDLYRWDASNLPLGPLRISLRELADCIGIHRNTVQLRLAALRRGGVLEGMVFEPRPRPIGLIRSGYLFHGARPSDGDSLTDVLEAFPFVSSAVLCMDDVFVHLWHMTDRVPSQDAETIRLALGAKEVLEGYVSSRFAPEPGDTARLSPDDIRLILALRRNPSRSMAAVARELGLPTHTVERRAAKLIRQGVGAMVPRFRPSRVQGWILVHYVAMSGRAASGLAAAFPDRVIGPFGSGQIPTVMVPLSNIAEVEERRWKAEQLPGVGPLRVVLVRDVVYPERFEEWLADSVESVQPDWTRIETAVRN